LARARPARAAVDSSRVTELTSAGVGSSVVLARRASHAAISSAHLEAVSLDGDVDTIATDLTNQTLE
jgi:hypothetical protein